MSDAAAEPRRRSWLRRLAATQAVLILAVVALRRTPQTNPELLQHGPRDLGYRAAKKTQGRAPGAALTTHLRGPLPTNSWWLDLARSPADDPAAAAYAVPFLFEKRVAASARRPRTSRPRRTRCSRCTTRGAGWCWVPLRKWALPS